MATGSLTLLAALAGIAGYSIYKHLKSKKKSTFARPRDR